MDNVTENTNTLVLPLLVTRGLVVFPNMTESIEAGRPYSVKAIDIARRDSNSLLFVGVQRQLQKDEVTGEEDVYMTATLCRVVNFLSANGVYRIRVIGSKRVALTNLRFDDGTWKAEGKVIPDLLGDQNEETALIRRIVKAVEQTPAIAHDIPKSALNALGRGETPNNIGDTLAAYLNFSIEDKIQILGEPEINKRLLKIAELLNEAQTVSEIDKKLDETVRNRAERSQKEYILREKMKAIRDELGEGDNEESDIDAIKKKVAENPYPQNVKDKVNKELKRFQMMPEASLESSLILNYINTLINAPWYEKTEDNDDLDNVQKILDEDHFGLDKVKKRIIEYLAVKHATGNLKAPILCFYGPPGCGKTSLAKSIARALGRKFFKASLGGVSDESEIRGHRRTYVGSMPGRIIHGMTKAGVINPVFLLDEIDKVGGSSLHGDPSSALLEVLDPEQNFAFNDNFIEEPYDLSNVLFIATANYLENVPAPLRDRLELIEVPSYTELEKIKIAAHWLVKKQMEMNGLKEGDIEFTEEGIKELIECYTREAGVRQLERLVASCCRKAVVELIKDPKHPRPIVIDSEQAQKYLGVEIFEDTKKEKEPQIGVVTGLAYTEFGGDILPIEVNYMSGKGGLVLTGKLGDVMKESCSIALDYVRANAEKYGIPNEMFEKKDIHIHVPEGAVPKDGPSAGVAITTAIVSCLTHTPVDNNVAMTGEVTLRGHALPIGGLREKSLAALRSGIKTIIVPAENKKDVGELPEEVKKELKIVYMKNVDDALEVALLKPEK
ncbi:MAG: endopeptidase La [Bacilli bacterium]|nr:endopeptidase La [Bacilli bacterium]